MTTSASSIAIVTDQLPYPPRNGITLPIYNYAIGLKKSHDVKFYLLTDENKPVDSNALEANEKIFGSFEIVALKRKGRITRLIQEISGVEMYQHGWISKLPNDVQKKQQYDTLIVSPMSAVAKFRASGLSATLAANTSIAAVNDCTTAEYYFRGKQNVGGFKSIIKGFIDQVRSRQIGKIEAQLLESYNHIFLQTQTDVNLMQRLVSDKISEKAITVPNGVRAEYYEITPAPEKNIVFVAELSGEYAATTQWLLTEVWPNIARNHPDFQLMIVGKGASLKLKSMIANTAQVKHIEFVEDLGQLYSHAAIVLSPVFKGFGLINKTLEAMAASVPVIGGIAAFNGIDGFINNVHGIACQTRTTNEFVDVISSLMSDEPRRENLGRSGRSIVTQQFRWEFSLQKIEALIGDAAC
jgi:glycosyltransferase involved in cell wall biosynthesis